MDLYGTFQGTTGRLTEFEKYMSIPQIKERKNDLE